MYRRCNFSNISAPCFSSGVVRAVETFESCGYALNTYGHIRNDFSELSDEQSALDFQRTLARMQEIADSSPDNSNKSFEEIVAMIKPRWCQTPAELDRFEQYVIDTDLEFYNSLKAKEAEAGATLDTDSGEISEVAS